MALGNQTANQLVLKEMQLSPDAIEEMRFATEAHLSQPIHMENNSVTPFEQSYDAQNMPLQDKHNATAQQSGFPRGQETAEFGSLSVEKLEASAVAD